MARVRRRCRPVCLAPRTPSPGRHSPSPGHGDRRTPGRRPEDQLKMLRLVAVVSLPVVLLSAGEAAPPCIRLTRAGTQVQGDVKICPGRYRISDPGERGVIVIAASLT